MTTTTTLNTQEQYEAAHSVRQFLAIKWDGPKLRKDFKAKWLEALRSGDYQRVKGSLRKFRLYKDPKRAPKPLGFCCLGVACDIRGEKWDDPRGEEYQWGSVIPIGTSKHSEDEVVDFPFIPKAAREPAYEEVEETVKAWWTDDDEMVTHVRQVTVRPALGSILAGLNDAGATFAQIADWIEREL